MAGGGRTVEDPSFALCFFVWDVVVLLCHGCLLSFYWTSFVFDISKIRLSENVKMLKRFLRTYVCIFV